MSVQTPINPGTVFASCIILKNVRRSKLDSGSRRMALSSTSEIHPSIINTMKIGIDARIYKTGIGRYTKNLTKELAAISSPEDSFIVFLRKTDIPVFQPPDGRFKAVEADFAPYSFAEQLKFLKILMDQNLDVVHFTNFNVPVLYPKPFIVTIHDLIHQSHSTFGSSTRNRLYYMLKKLVYFVAIRWVAFRAKAVIVPSESTKHDVVQHLKIPKDKIKVTYEGFDSNVKESTTPSEQLFEFLSVQKPYVLYVATMYPHKNHRTLIDAMRVLRDQGKKYQLVLVGKVDHFSQKLKEEYKELEREGHVRFVNFAYEDGYTPDQVMATLYRHADAYVFPSLKEGFGIPVLEAQSYGIPVACSNVSCLPEIGGDSVYYIDPYSAESIAKGIDQIITNNELRTTLVDLGYKNVSRFSWKIMAKQTYDVYTSVIKLHE